MSLTHLLIRNFRNIKNANLAFSPSFNFLVGGNGSGKTSILEAIYTLGHGRAYRSLHINNIIHHNNEEFILHGSLHNGEREITIGFKKDKKNRSKINIDGTNGHKVSELAMLIPMQLITPERFTLISGGPKYRRAFLDWGCFHNKVSFFTSWSRLKRLLKQRNAALHQVTSYYQLQPWDLELIPLAEQISQWRADYSADIAKNITYTCKQLLPEFCLTFSFQRGWKNEEDYAEVLKKNFERDRIITHTTYGPHKAYFNIYANNMPVECILSRGQLKLLICSLQLTQGKLLVRESKRQCLYLIDDFSSELDDVHRRLLASSLKDTRSQVFISTISINHIVDISDKNSKIFIVDKGKIID